MEKDDISRHGIAISLGESFTLGPVKQVGRNLSSTTAASSVGYVSKLPPAVANVPKEHIRDYAHGKTVNSYLIGNVLGEGSFAKVKEALHTIVGEKVAIKVIDKRKAAQDPYVSRNFKREAKLLQMVHHPNIIQLYEVIETDNSYYLVTELCSGGELMKHIYRKGHLSEDETRKYIRQIVSAVDHLHKSGIIHRDLKVENLLLDSNMDIKLIDFGLSNEEFVQVDEGKLLHCNTQCGSPAYAAPELLGHKAYGPEVDIWSIGVNMYAMLTGCLPYTVEPFNITALHAKILENKMNPIPETISPACGNLLHKLLTPSPENRITMAMLFQDPWLNEGHKLPFTPSPFPNTLTANDINEDITEHMVYALRIRESQMEVTQELLSHRATSTTAIYFLLIARLKRYKKDCTASKTKKQHKKASKPGDEVSTASLQTSLNTNNEERNTIVSARRHTLPPSELDGALSPFRQAASTKAGGGMTNKTRSAPRRGWDTGQDIQLAPVRPPISLKRNSMQVHPLPDITGDEQKATVPNRSSAWSQNPPPVLTNPHSYSRDSSKYSLSGQKAESNHSRESSDDLTFYQVGVSALPIKHATSTPYDPPQDLPLPPIPRQPFNDAKRYQKTIHKGVAIVPTEMMEKEILIEIFRVAANLKTRFTEQSAPNTVKCTFKDITFTVTVTKDTKDSCNLSFQWLSGGDYASYMGVCEDMLSKLHL